MAGTEQFSVMTLIKARDLTGGALTTASGRFSAFANRGASALAKVNAGFRATDAAIGRLVGSSLLLGAGVALVGDHALGAGADFEEAMSGIAAVTLQPKSALAGLEAQARELGRTTKFTSTEAALAMETMARAGFSVKDIMAGVPGVLYAAAASGMEMAEVSEHVASIIKGMALETGEAARVADVLALASARSKSTIGSLGESMQSISPIAKQFGFSLEDAVAMAAKMQDVGIDASEAGNSIKTMLTKLTDPSDKAAAIMKEAGVSFIDSYGNMKPPKELFEQAAKLRSSMQGNAKSVQAFSELVGLRGQKALMVLGDLFSDVNEEGKTFSEMLDGAAGTAKKMSEMKLDNLRGDMTLLSSAVDGVYQSMFDLSGGPLRAVVKGTTRWVEANRELLASKMGNFVAGLATDLPIIADRALLIGKIFLGYKAAAWTIGGAQLAMKGFAVASGWAATAQAYLARKVIISTAGMGSLGATSTTVGAQMKASMMLALPAIAAVGAALGALALLYNRVSALDDDLSATGGLSGTYDKMQKMDPSKNWWNMSPSDLFNAHDAALNEQAAQRQKTEENDKKFNAAGAMRDRYEREGLAPATNLTDEWEKELDAMQSKVPVDQSPEDQLAALQQWAMSQGAPGGAPMLTVPQESKTEIDVTINDKTGVADVKTKSSGSVTPRVQTKRSGDL